MKDPIGQLVIPVVGAIVVTFFTWSLNRNLSRGRPMTSFSKKLLSHGFLFVLGVGLFIGWNDQLALLLRFQGREVWRPLSFGWAVLLLYDATRRLHRERERNKDGDYVAAAETEEPPPPNKFDWNDIGRTALRFFLFFAVLGAIGMRQIAAYFTVVALAAALWLLERKARRTTLPPEHLS